MNIPHSKPGTSMENKTGSWRSQKPEYDKKKCIKCSKCVQHCPEGCITGPPEDFPVIDYDYCKGCGICKEICPVKCIEMVEEK